MDGYGMSGAYGPPPPPGQQMGGGMFGGNLTPQQIQALLDYSANQGAFTEQDRAVQQQLAAAQALRDRGPSHHTTGIGGGLGAIGDVLGAYAGRRDLSAAQERDKVLQDARIAALRRLSSQYGQQQPETPDPMAGVPPMLARPPGT